MMIPSINNSKGDAASANNNLNRMKPTDPLPTPNRFLMEVSNLKFTPGPLTRLGVSESNPFEASFASTTNTSDSQSLQVPTAPLPEFKIPADYQQQASSSRPYNQPETHAHPIPLSLTHSASAHLRDYAPVPILPQSQQQQQQQQQQSTDHIAIPGQLSHPTTTISALSHLRASDNSQASNSPTLRSESVASVASSVTGSPLLPPASTLFANVAAQQHQHQHQNFQHQLQHQQQQQQNQQQQRSGYINNNNNSNNNIGAYQQQNMMASNNIYQPIPVSHNGQPVMDPRTIGSPSSQQQQSQQSQQPTASPTSPRKTSARGSAAAKNKAISTAGTGDVVKEVKPTKAAPKRKAPAAKTPAARGGKKAKTVAAVEEEEDQDDNVSDSDNDNDDVRSQSGSTIGGGGKYTDAEKRKRFLERNRIAASKCRQKKKQWIYELERKASEATERNAELNVLVGQLREEVLMLKNQMLLHRKCGCQEVQGYLRDAGKQFSQQGNDTQQ
ncbi:hypothetical protein HDU76_013695 [Blyttiomyces sp. JEL0837]|nr:hypothetical protein HDU76_013695 [Blyttiomyces sp. JEL0837]